MGIKIEMTKYDPIPAGVYLAQIGAVDEAEGQFGPQLKIRFDLLDDEHSDRALTGWTSCKLSPKSKLYTWSKAAIFGGRDIPATWSFDSDGLLGRQVQIVVSAERGSDGETYNKVKDVLPLRQRAARPAPVPDAQPRAPQPAAITPEPPPLDYDALVPPADDEELD